MQPFTPDFETAILSLVGNSTSELLEEIRNFGADDIVEAWIPAQELLRNVSNVVTERAVLSVTLQIHGTEKRSALGAGTHEIFNLIDSLNQSSRTVLGVADGQILLGCSFKSEKNDQDAQISKPTAQSTHFWAHNTLKDWEPVAF
jgi:hypothetical protein